MSWDLLMVLAECHKGSQLSGMLLEGNVYSAGLSCALSSSAVLLGEREAKTPQWTWRLAPSDIMKFIFLGHQTWLEIRWLMLRRAGDSFSTGAAVASCFPSAQAQQASQSCRALALPMSTEEKGKEGGRKAGGRQHRRQRQFFLRKAFLLDLKIAFRRNLVSHSSVRGWEMSQDGPWAVSRLTHKSAAAGAILCSHPGLLEPGAEPQAGRLHNIMLNLPAEGLIWRESKCILQLWTPS